MNNNLKPILKWAGGKTQMLPNIIENLPIDITNQTKYVEPFIGAGAVFLHFIKENQFSEYIINDINTKLINLYICIKEDTENLIQNLEKLQSEYLALTDINLKEEYYYNIREKFNSDNNDTTITSAWLIFLNKTCYNGLYRENSKGNFNVPFGKHEAPNIYDKENIKLMSKMLNKKNVNGEYLVKIFNTSFENLISYIDATTFVYLDPPYRPITSRGFTAYNKSNFNDASQINLSQFYFKLDQYKAKLMLSNSDPKVLNSNDMFFDNLYSSYEIKRVSAKRMINRNGKGRGPITELLITNYK